MHDELQHMKNLGKTSAQWLHAVGIHSASDLRRLGAVDAYRAVRARGFRASKVLMYAIEGALPGLAGDQPGQPALFVGGGTPHQAVEPGLPGQL